MFGWSCFENLHILTGWFGYVEAKHKKGFLRGRGNNIQDFAGTIQIHRNSRKGEHRVFLMPAKVSVQTIRTIFWSILEPPNLLQPKNRSRIPIVIRSVSFLLNLLISALMKADNPRMMVCAVAAQLPCFFAGSIIMRLVV